MRIGIDVGGTNTDAVLMDGIDVLGWRKTPTTPDVGYRHHHACCAICWAKPKLPLPTSRR